MDALSIELAADTPAIRPEGEAQRVPSPARPTADGAARTVLRVSFTSPAEFADELRARGPNVEPVVRLTYRWTAGANGLPLQHVSVVASYVSRLSGGELVLVELAHYAGEVWRGLHTEASERAHERADKAHEHVAAAVHALGLEPCAGTYAAPNAREAAA